MCVHCGWEEQVRRIDSMISSLDHILDEAKLQRLRWLISSRKHSTPMWRKEIELIEGDQREERE